jgi:hypothetical protein
MLNAADKAEIQIVLYSQAMDEYLKAPDKTSARAIVYFDLAQAFLAKANEYTQSLVK